MASTIKVDDNKNYGSIDPISKIDPTKPKGKLYYIIVCWYLRAPTFLFQNLLSFKLQKDLILL